MTTHANLLLMRHGKSDWHTGARDDFSRPLSARGRRDCPRIGQWLATNNLQPAHILCSPAQRTRETAEYLCDAAGIDLDRVTFEPDLYLADTRTMMSVIAMHAGNGGPLMLIGHNPGLEELLLYLSDPTQIPQERGKLMPTATLAWLASDSRQLPPAAGRARLQRLIRPRDLQD